jgi:LEA14-like dessication related protein
MMLTACAAGFTDLQTPNVTLSNIQPAADITVFEQRYDVTLRIQNTNNVALPVSGLSYAVTLNEQEFARGVSNENVVIPALGERLVHVTVTTGPLDWIKQVDHLQSKPETVPTYSITGVLYLEGLPGRKLPFSKSGKFFAGE